VIVDPVTVMAIVPPEAVVEAVAEEVELVDDDVEEGVAEVDGLAVVVGVVAPGGGDPLEHPASATAVAATTAAVVRRRIPLISPFLMDESCLAGSTSPS
jgi:hypothetical protein